MRFCAPLAVALAACYAPAVHPGAPCGPNGECPSQLECRDNVCVVPGTMLDDAPTSDDAPIDSSMVTFDAPADADPSYVPWGTAVEIPSLNAVSGTGEDDPSFTQNRLTVIETSGTPDDLYECTRPAIGMAFTCAAITALNTAMTEKSPEISADGQTLYFISDRSGAFDVYLATRGGGGWGTASRVAELSTASTDDDMAVSPDGLTAIVSQDAGPNRMTFSTRASTAVVFSNPVVHAELQITADITSPTITNGGVVIYFHAGATRDIYTARRMGNGNYMTPSPVTELNTAGRDAAPFVSADNKYMMFERDGDIFESSRP